MKRATVCVEVEAKFFGCISWHSTTGGNRTQLICKLKEKTTSFMRVEQAISNNLDIHVCVGFF